MAVNANMLIIIASGILVGIGASFSGLGGGFLMVPLLLFLGYSAQKAVGTSFLAILIISISALLLIINWPMWTTKQASSLVWAELSEPR